MIPVDFNGGELGNCQRPIRTTGPQGERVALANSETIPAGSSITFEIILFDEDHEDVVTEWLNYGKWRGLAQWRNSGKGRFTWQGCAERLGLGIHCPGSIDTLVGGV